MRLAYDDAGRGDCVVLVHGHRFDRTLWQPQVAALRDDFRVLAPDLRGFGQSPVTPHSVTAEILDCLRHPELVLIEGVGHLPNLEAEREFNDALRTFLRAYAPG